MKKFQLIFLLLFLLAPVSQSELFAQPIPGFLPFDITTTEIGIGEEQAKEKAKSKAYDQLDELVLFIEANGGQIEQVFIWTSECVSVRPLTHSEYNFFYPGGELRGFTSDTIATWRLSGAILYRPDSGGNGIDE